MGIIEWAKIVFNPPVPQGMCRCCRRPYFNKDSEWGQRGLCMNCWQMLDLATQLVTHYIDELGDGVPPVAFHALESVRARVNMIRIDPFAVRRMTSKNYMEAKPSDKEN